MPSCVVPHELGVVVRNYGAGLRDDAVSEWERLLPLIHFENRHLGLQATKILLKDAGIIASNRSRAPLPVCRTRSVTAFASSCAGSTHLRSIGPVDT
jgi:dihydrodipicolinate synthase/N-acetylneuraminate lyase